MDITYLGHSCFKLRVAGSSVVTDPYSKRVGFSLPRVSADLVTVSHAHDDHNNTSAVVGTSRREQPFFIDAPGEYEVGGVSVFGVSAYHDDKKGELRGENILFAIVMDGVSVVHLGDLGHELTDRQVAGLNGVDVLLCPVGGHYTLGPKQVVSVVNQLEPSILIPMHYRSDKHSKELFGDVVTLEEFLKEFGGESRRVEKLTVTKGSMPEEMELVVLENLS